MKKPAQLIDEIIDLAVEGNVKVSILLRKCRLISENFGNEILRDWVICELNGYEDWNNLPSYRVADINSKGFFVGPLGAQINDQPLATSVLRDAHRHLAEKVYFRDPASAYECVREDGDGAYRIEWSGDLVAAYQSSFFKGYVLNRAWQDIPSYILRSIPEVVINRILEFSLSIRREFGEELSAGNDQINEYVDSAVMSILRGS